MDILIIKLGALGDVINTLPLAVILKEQLSARIHWLVAPLSYPLLQRHPAVDHPILFDRRDGIKALGSILKQLRDHPFDLVLDLQRILKSGFFCLAARGKRKIGFDRRRCKELTWLLPFERIPPSDPHAHMVDQYLAFARFLGLSTVPVVWQIEAQGRRPDGLPPEFIALNIGATKPANRWTAKGFSTLAELIAEHFLLPCVLTGGPEDSPMAEKIQRLAGGNVVNLVGRTTLPELVRVIDAASAVVTCDTGPMHLAVALGRRVVALFGPSDHRRTGPYKGRVLRSRLSCAPCNRKSCAAPECMDAICPEEVLRILSEEINGEKFCH